MTEQRGDSEKQVDIEKIFMDKNPKLLKLIPGFIIRYLKRVIHQDELNEAFVELSKKNGLEYIDEALSILGTKTEVYGLDNIPKEGRFVFAANHPLGGLDGMMLTQVIGRVFPDLKFLVNDILMRLKGVGTVFLAVNKHGKQSTEYARKIEAAYASDTQIINFPAGLCSRKIKGEIIDLEWQKSFIQKAVSHKRDIIPIYVDAKNTNWFYNLSNFRKRLGIKANLEMLYLVDEMFKQGGKTVRIYFGKPISYEMYDKSRKPKEWAKFVREKAYEMKK